MIVLLETDELLVVDKPAGALSVPSRMGHDDPRPCVLYALTDQLGGQQFWPVHRLDEEVSGVLAFAKTRDAHRRLNALFESRSVEKTYEAWTEHNQNALPPTREARFEDRLHRGKKRSFVAAHGKPAITVARVTGQVNYAGQSLLRWQLAPLTGRSHQLRVQLALRGFPIAGDRLYGATTQFAGDAIALRAVRLKFEDVVVEARSLESWLQLHKGV